MPLRFLLLGRRRPGPDTTIFRSGFAYARRRTPAGVLPGWRDRYRWDTVLLVALLLGLCFLGMWATTHPID